MERLLVLPLLVLTMSAVMTAQNNLTLDDIFIQLRRVNLNSSSRSKHNAESFRRQLFVSDPSGQLLFDKADETKIFRYLTALSFRMVKEISKNLGRVSEESILEDLKGHCPQPLGTPIKNLFVKLSNTTCVTTRLSKLLTSSFLQAIDVSFQNFSSGWSQIKLKSVRLAEKRHCTQDYEDRLRQLLRGHVQDYSSLLKPDPGSSPLDIMQIFLQYNIDVMSKSFNSVKLVMRSLQFFFNGNQSIDPLTFENLLHPFTLSIPSKLYSGAETTQSEDASTWGIVTSNTGSVTLPCSNYRRVYNRNHFRNIYGRCFIFTVRRAFSAFLTCAYRDPTATPLAWATPPSLFVHSQCLCLASNGTDCGVKPPQEVDPRVYCLSMLLRDFQRQVWYRPALTYLDYASQTPVNVCKFPYLLSLGFTKICQTYRYLRVSSILATRCYFKDLLNKEFNCKEQLTLDSYDVTELCNASMFHWFVLCNGNAYADEDFYFRYYGTGDSALVMAMTYLDVAVRVLTLVTFLACPQLRNLPGKLLIAYMMTALLRLLVVRASLEDFLWAVRLDVALDLASTLWLSAYLHFLTVSIMYLRTPDSLRPDEAHMVLLRYALMGWALPAALSAAFFTMDETIHSHVKVGQLLFVLCNYAALFCNLYMFFKNCKFYFQLKREVRGLQKHVKAHRYFADLFNFALKTSLLSGAGISFRLLFTQIQGLEHVLSYYHALGTLQGFLIFLLYGCNRKARAFWLEVSRSILRRCRLLLQNTTPHRNSFELEQIPSQNVADTSTEEVAATVE